MENDRQNATHTTVTGEQQSKEGNRVPKGECLHGEDRRVQEYKDLCSLDPNSAKMGWHAAIGRSENVREERARPLDAKNFRHCRRDWRQYRTICDMSW